jgi:GTP-binding protein LepA
MDQRYIRNFCIIAHIDHGKSTLADRLLEETGTVEKRKMKAQLLDQMDLERERGITIKLQPVRMEYEYSGTGTRQRTTNNEQYKADSNQQLAINKEQGAGNREQKIRSRSRVVEAGEYVLNLIDTPGHVDFHYEVSRSLAAVEGAILLVDATKGVQAQTLTTLEMAKSAGLTIIPAVSKIDSPLARIDDVKLEIAEILDCDLDDIIEVSGRTGQGITEILDQVIKKIPAPTIIHTGPDEISALIFDFEYSNHQGVIVYVRMFDGGVARADQVMFSVANEKFNAMEVGTFNPGKTSQKKLSAGEIGYIVTGIKQPGIASVGDTITSAKKPLQPLFGYQNPRPVI